MTRRKIDEERIRKIQKSKGSYYITLPVELIRKFNWKERQKVVVKEGARHTFVISDWKK